MGQRQPIKMAAGIPVESNAPHLFPHSGVPQGIAGAFIHPFFVVVPNDNLGIEPFLFEHRRQMVADQFRFIVRRVLAAFPRLGRGGVILDRHGLDRHAFCLIALQVPGHITGPHIFPVVPQFAAKTGVAGGFHPAWRAPRRRKQEKFRIYFQNVLHHGQNVNFILP